MEALKFKIKEMMIKDLNLEDIRPEDIIDDDPLFKEGLGLDSIEALQLVLSLEEHFGVIIPDLEMGLIIFKSVTSIAQYITGDKNSDYYQKSNKA